MNEWTYCVTKKLTFWFKNQDNNPSNDQVELQDQSTEGSSNTTFVSFKDFVVEIICEIKCSSKCNF